jgi:glycosyltransferase involved in cell wall biosynthesis
MKRPNYILFQGNIENLSSFSLVNRILVHGLRRLGYGLALFPTDSHNRVDFPKEIPDVYIFHGHPYDYRSSPGRFNIFVLNYEYFRIKKEDEILINRLNNYFDLVLVSTHFVMDALSRNGLSVPIKLLPWGVDRTEFNPSVKPRRTSGSKRFNFLYTGAFYPRKGIDVLIRAYLDEFSHDDDVSLIIKEAMRVKHMERWVEKVMKAYYRLKSRNPRIIHVNSEDKSIAGYYTAADVGVFPFRGEGFGLPILECIASGRRVIVTEGTGPMDFCNSNNASFIKAEEMESRDHLHLEPDVGHLRLLMREAFERGKLNEEERAAISDSVKHFTWRRTVETLDSVIKQIPRRRSDSRSPAKSRDINCHSPVVAYSYFQTGPTSWKKYCRKIDQLLRKNFTNYHSIDFTRGFSLNAVDLIVGQSEYCLESFLRSSELNGRSSKILPREGGVLEERIKINNRERRKCGLEPIRKTPMELWRNRLECDLADFIVLSSSVAKKYFVKCGYDQKKLKVIPWGIDLHEPHVRKMTGKMRFLFVGTDPCRKGIRTLFEAWDQLKLKNVELVCIADHEVLLSPLLIRYLVKNPNIVLKKTVPYNRFLNEYFEIDCQVLPSLEDTFSFVIGEGMGYGKPAIVSRDTGISDLITHLHDGYIVKTGSVEELKEAILYFYENRNRVREMGESAYEIARKYSWERFGREFVDFAISILDYNNMSHGEGKRCSFLRLLII